MPRQKNPDCQRAEKLYQESGETLTLKEIAEQLHISESTIRSWKNRYGWEKKSGAALQTNNKKDGSVANKKECGVANEKGKKGNQNAVGHGAPKGNKNHLKHGIYEKILFDFLSEEEQQLFLEQEIDEAEECRKMIRFCDVQIMKFMRKIKELEEKPGGLVVCGVSKKKGRIEGLQRDAASDFTEEQTTTSTTAVHELILRYNNEIEKAKKQKMKCLELLLKYEQQKDGEQEQTSAVHIYLPSNDRETTENR